MSKNPLLVLLPFLVAGACVLVAGAFFLCTDSQTWDVHSNSPHGLTENDREASGPIEVNAVRGHDDQQESFDDQSLDSSMRVKMPASGNIRHLVAKVWEGETGTMAGEADVFFLDGFDGSEFTDPFAQHWSDLAERRGQRFKTDSQGRIELPPVQQWAMVTARLPGLHGFAMVGGDHYDVEWITLWPDETVTVRVTDNEDRPVVGVPVGVIQHVPAYGKPRKSKGHSQPQITTRPELRAKRLTDADGMAVFRHFQLYRHDPERWWPAQHIDQFEAVLLMPLPKPASYAFTGNPVPTEALELRMPTTGSIALRSVDHDGRPFTHPVHAELRMDDRPAAPWTRVQISKEQDEKSIVFPFIGLGLQFTAHCRLEDDDFRWVFPPFSGPSNPGERVTLDLVVAPEEGMLFGRLLDGKGMPLAGVRPSFLITSHAGRLEGEEITLDIAGRFHLPYKQQEPHRAPFRLEIRRNDVNPTAGLAMNFPTLTTKGVTDLGDLRIDAFDPMAHGAVVDDRGLPIKGATVRLQRERLVGGKQPQLAFVDEAFTVGHTDAEGRYELFGQLESGRYRLRVQAQDHFPVESPDLRQGELVDLTLQRKARVVGTVLTPTWLPSNRVRVCLESAVDPQQRRDDQVHSHEGKKYIHFDWVKAGIYNVLLRTPDYPDPFLRIDGLEVLPGQQELHPRLRDLDLGTFLFRFDIAAVDEQGQPIQPDRPLLARIVRPDGRTGYVGFPWHNCRVEILSACPQLEVWPLAWGYRAEPTVLIQGRSEIRFLEVPPLELHLPGLRRLAGATPVWISIQEVDTGLPDRLEAWDPGSGQIAKWYSGGKARGAMLGEEDTVRVKLIRDGLYRVIAYLVGDQAMGVKPVSVDLGAVDVRLVPGAEPQRVAANIDTALVQAALAELARRTAAREAGYSLDGL